MDTRRIGTCLHEQEQITASDLEQALALQGEIGGLLGQALIRLGALSEEDLLAALHQQLDLPVLAPEMLCTAGEDYVRAMEALELTPAWLLARRAALWCAKGSKQIQMVAHHILDQELDEIVSGSCARAGMEVQTHLAANQTLEMALSYIAELDEQAATPMLDDDDTQRLREMAEGAPVIDFVNRVFQMALKENASDIHIEPFEHKFQVRYRIDGVLRTRQNEPKSRFDAVASRVKLLSGMDIAERRLPQDGRQSIRFAGQEIDLRVSSLPGSWGESLVLRLLRKENQLPDLQSLGLDGRAKTVLSDLLSFPNGVILVTGPTGSGKSTTLYRSLMGLNDGIQKVITIEDPVEYDMDGIIQIQTRANIGYTFARGLRAILRQDPDIIMVGEIRDGETATIAAQAALTGHLVLSTLHTNSALAAIARLMDIGLEPYMVASSLRGLVAQRLVRRLCPKCSVPEKNPQGDARIKELLAAGLIDKSELATKANWRVARGCELCGQSGYLGRIALFEVVKIDEALSDAILTRASLPHLLVTARNQNFLTLIEDGTLKARNGITPLTEVTRVTGTNQQKPQT